MAGIPWLLVFGMLLAPRAGCSFETGWTWPAAQAPAATAESLDFQFYRTRVEPIFLKMREGLGPGGACFLCHTRVTSRFRLQPLSPGAISWSEEQSRRNFEVVKQLVSPGEPLKSRLLLHPLAAGAGGDPVHGGGKYWQSQDDPEWQTLATWVRAATAAAGAGSLSASAPVLDFEVFKARVQPIFLNKRAGFARCYVCHSQGTNFRLQSLPPGRAAWNEDESRRNFEAVQRVVVPGDPLSSRLLMLPLATEAGGEPFHPGGKRWSSRDDPEWETVASWVRGQPPGGSRP